MRIHTTLIILFLWSGLQAQWQSIGFGTSTNLTSVDFVNESTGLVCGTNKIWKSTDSGQNWTQVYSGAAAVSLEEVHWASENLAIAVGFNGSTALILRSGDGGQNWSQVSVSVVSLLTDIFFINDQVGWVCGGNTTILKTSNGGQSWTLQKNDNTSDLLGIFFTDEQTGYAVGGLPGVGRVLKTTNSGQSWSDLSPASPNLLVSVFFPSANTGYVCGDGGQLIKTLDGGSSWGSLNSNSLNSLTDLYFFNDDYGFLVGGTLSVSTIKKTENGGLTWMAEGSTGAGLFSVDVVGETGYACGLNGTLLKAEVPVATKEKFLGPLEVYPNPASDMVQVNVPEQAFGKLILYSEIGQPLKCQDFENSGQTSLAMLPAGKYLLVLRTTAGVWRQWVFKRA